MAKLAIIGAGHAGVEAAAVAAASGVEVDLFSNEGVLPYFRPRLIAVACGQAEADTIAIRKAEWYEQRGIKVHLNSEVTSFDPATRTLVGNGFGGRYDAVVLSCGSLPLQPRIEGAGAEFPFTVLWNMRNAMALRGKIVNGTRLLVIGGGVLGVEAALRAAEVGACPVVVEMQPRLLRTALCATTAAVLTEQIIAAGVEVRCGRSVQRFRLLASGNVVATLDNGDEIEVELVVFSIGAAPNRKLSQAAGLQTDRGVVVDDFLQTSWAGVFAVGDLAQYHGGVSRCAVRDATMQGKSAAANAVAFINGSEMTPYVPPKPMMMMKVGSVEAYALGEVDVTDDEVAVRLDDGSVRRICRMLVRRGDDVVGVQMVGSRDGFDEACEKWSGK